MCHTWQAMWVLCRDLWNENNMSSVCSILTPLVLECNMVDTFRIAFKFFLLHEKNSRFLPAYHNTSSNFWVLAIFELLWWIESAVKLRVCNYILVRLEMSWPFCEKHVLTLSWTNDHICLVFPLSSRWYVHSYFIRCNPFIF